MSRDSGCGLIWTIAAILVSAGTARAQLPEPEPEPTPLLPAAPVVPKESASELDLFNLEQKLNEMVVTASGEEEERSLTAANVYVISREDIARHGWRSLLDMLSAVPGLYAIDTLALPILSVRGVSGGIGTRTSLVKIMIDGQVVNFRPELTAFLGPEFIPVEAIERVEIAKGPLSALRGANAFLATINVITREPGKGLSSEVAARAHVVRSNGGYGVSGYVSYGTGKLGLVAALTFDHIDRSGLRLQQTFDAQNLALDLFQRESQGDLAQPSGGFLKLFADSNRLGSLTVEGGVQNLDTNYNFQLNSVLTNRSRLSLLNLWTNLRYEKNWAGKVNLFFSGGYSYGTPTRDTDLRLTNNNSSTFTPRYNYHGMETSLQVAYTPIGNLKFLAGLDVEYSHQRVLYYTQTYLQTQGVNRSGDEIDLIPANRPREADLYDIGAYLQVSYHADSLRFPRLSRLQITGNLRLDKIATGPFDYLEYSWRAAAAYRWSSQVVTKLIAGRAFQAPSAVLLFAEAGFGIVNDVRGNLTTPLYIPPLRSQTINSVEAVISSQFLGHVSLEVSLYYQQLQNLIQFTQAASILFALNGSTRDSVGVELVCNLAFGRFLTYFGGSIERAIGEGGFDTHTAAFYPFAVALAGINVDIPEARLRFSTRLRYVGTRGASQSNATLNNQVFYELPDYWDWGITVSTMKLYLFGDKLETRLLVAAKNLLGQEYFEPGFGGYDVPALGRTFTLELRQNF